MVEPVQELRELRKAALQVNAACNRWAIARRRGGRDRTTETLAHCALVGWRVARVITGWLQSHPNWRLHPSECRVAEFAMRASAVGESLLYFSDGSRLNWLDSKLDYLERRSANIRAITSSAAINDMLSRHQPDLKALRRALQSLQPRPTTATESLNAAVPRTPTSSRTRLFARSADADWPYLSF